MNYALSLFFRLVPVAMALVCFAYGGIIYLTGDDAARLTAGPVVFFLGAVCLALYTTAATIIRQIIGTYRPWARWALPALGYGVAAVTFVVGLLMTVRQPQGALYVAGHVVCGLGLIALSVSTAATASTRFRLIPLNSARRTPQAEREPNPEGFNTLQERIMELAASLVALGAWVWAVVLLTQADQPTRLVAGSVMAGIACVTTSLVALVASIARQVRGVYRHAEKEAWMSLVLVMGALAFLYGVVYLLIRRGEPDSFTGYVLIGLGLICWSISSKVILLAKIWRDDFPLASRMPIVPVMTALTCLFMAAFLFEAALGEAKFFVPARVLVGLGAVCFTLFSIVSILESGTATPHDDRRTGKQSASSA